MEADCTAYGEFLRYPDEDGDGLYSSAVWCCENSFWGEYHSGGSWSSSPGSDCDDSNVKKLSRSSPETCDGIDNNCDSQVDEGVKSTLYYDADGDVYGVSSSTISSCPPVSNYSAVGGDCDDNTTDGDDVNPGKPEACDGVDTNCSGSVSGYEADGDKDGYMDCSISGSSVLRNDSLSGGSDCLDGGSLGSVTYSGVATKENAATKALCLTDEDEDGFGATVMPSGASTSSVSVTVDGVSFTIPAWVAGTDCDDTTKTGPYVNSDKLEACDGLDNDCAGGVPSNETDKDGDGYVECSYNSSTWYGSPSVHGGGDCDDVSGGKTESTTEAGVMVTSESIHPDSVEICNGLDDDCDGVADEGLALYSFYLDNDEDGYGDSSNVETSCMLGRGGRVLNAADCDDSRFDIKPGAPEVCNGLDDNCKDGSDEALTVYPWFLDADGDHAGAGDPYLKCNDPDNVLGVGYEYPSEGSFEGLWVSAGDDCDDLSAAVYPAHYEWDATTSPAAGVLVSGVIETCDLIDNDCDDSVDEEVQTTYYYDADGDGYGSSAVQQLACQSTPPGGFVEKPDDDNVDCNDDDRTVHPFNTATSKSEDLEELCDGQLNDCYLQADGVPTDEVDTDGDNYVACDNTTVTWKGPAAIKIGADCDPEDPYTYPFAEELCDGITNDCFQRDDAGYALSNLPVDEVDDDVDGYVECEKSDRVWNKDAEESILDGADCDDTDPLIFPEATELCDGQRNDCDFYTDGVPTDEVDTDGDTFVECGYTVAEEWSGDKPSEGLDCDPDDANRYPGAYEVCDGVWDDCNAAVADGGANPGPDDEQDLDGDKYVGCGYDPSAYAWASGVAPREGIDCGQTDATVYPGAYEECDGQFNDCDDGSYVAGLAPDVELDDDADGWVECEILVSVTWVGEEAVQDALDLLPDGGFDCDDEDGFAFPGAAPEDDPNGCLRDGDDDGYGDVASVDPVSPGSDCDDDNVSVYPGASEVCEDDLDAQVDNDCDGDVNTQGDFPTSYGEENAYPDEDGDSFGSDDGRLFRICVFVDGYSRSSTDCDDTREDIHPGADEYCNGADEDCDAVIDEADDLAPEGAGCLDGYRDVDGDGFGDFENHMCLCMDSVTADYRGDAYVLDSTDCYDYDANIAPGKGVVYSEICDNGVDDDADGVVDSDDDDCQMVLSDGSPGELCGDGTDNDGDGDIDVDDADCPRAGQRVRTQTEWLDGDDNDCDGYLPVIELDCDDDGSLPMVDGSDEFEFSSEIGLEACVPGSDSKISLNCLGATDLEATCNLTTRLWEVRYTQSDDGFGGRFDGGRRVWPEGRVCTSAGDCDDHCASRCTDLEEACDGIDNNCSDVELTADIDGIPASMDEGVSLPGTVPASEVDIDEDGYLSCGSGVGPDHIYRVTASCLDTAKWGDPELLSDCDNTCTLSSPVAVERCDGAVGLCDGPAEGVDDDGDGLSTCGAWSADETLDEDVYMLVHVSRQNADLEPMDTGAETGAQLPDEVFSPNRNVIPLLLPRRLSVDCDEDLAVALQAIIPGAALDEAINSRIVSALLAPCVADPSSCGVVRITLDKDADEEVYDDYADNMSEDCAAHPEQMVTRTVWSAERINEARQTVIEWECLRLYGKDCDDVTEATPLRDAYSAVPSDPGAELTTDVRWWKEMGRYTPIWAANGAYETCWGDPADSTTEVSVTVGGDCADGNDESNRYAPEGPDDLVAIYEGTVVDCAACMDGIDNNCDGEVDCDDPSCAVCFVGSGGGCAASGSPCEPSACSASPESASASALAMLGLLVLAGGRRRSRE